MKDLRIVTAKVILTVYSVSPIRGFLPLSIVAIGKRLDLATEVLYNGVTADEFVVSSSTRLIIRIPPSQVGRAFTDLKVLAPVSAAQQEASLSFGIQRPAKTLSGIDRLVQSWVMVFFTTPGSDVFDPESGGGAKSLIGKTTDRAGKNISADLAMAVERTKQELLRLQSRNQNIPPSEKLLSSSLDTVQFDSDTTVLSARINIQNMLGDAAEVSLG